MNELIESQNNQDENVEKTNPKQEMPAGDSIANVNYNVMAEESEIGYKYFQSLYVKKSCIKKTVFPAIILILFLIQGILKPMQYFNWVVSIIMATAIFIIWYNPVILRKSIVKALKPLENDSYIFKLYNDSFTIETILSDSELVEDEVRYQPEPRVVWFKDKNYKLFETEKLIFIIIDEQTIYFIPKRCMVQPQIDLIKEKLV